MHRLGLVLVGCVLLGLAPGSVGASPSRGAVLLSGEIARVAGSPRTYTVTVATGGSRTYRTVVFTINGIDVTSGTRPGTECLSDGHALRCTGLALGRSGRDGQQVTFTVQTDNAVRDNAGGDVKGFYAEDAAPDIGQLMGPAPAATPPPPPPPPPASACECTSLTMKVSPTKISVTRRGGPERGTSFGLGLTWEMRCTAGEGGCKGQIRVLPAKILPGRTAPRPLHALARALPRRGIVSCNGPCKPAASSVGGAFQVRMLSPDGLDRFAGRTLVFSFELSCLEPGKTTLVGTRKIEVTIGQGGRVTRVRMGS